MSLSRVASVVLALASVAAAQTLSLTALTPTTAVAQDGAGSQTATLRAGPMSLNSAMLAITPSDTRSSLQWYGSADTAGFGMLLQARCTVVGPSASSSVAPGEVLMSVSLPTSTNVWFRMAPSISGPVGSAIPFLRVDIGNDGSDEMTEATQSPIIVGVTLGPVPLLVRVRASAALAVPGDLLAGIWIQIVPNDNTFVSPIYPGCGAEPFQAFPTFDGNLAYATTTGVTFNQPGVVVLGLTLQPLVLSPQPFYGSCLLLPSADVVLLSQPSSLQVLQIPAAARPITVWIQAVDLNWAGELVPSEAFRLNAF